MKYIMLDIGKKAKQAHPYIYMMMTKKEVKTQIEGLELIADTIQIKSLSLNLTPFVSLSTNHKTPLIPLLTIHFHFHFEIINQTSFSTYNCYLKE